MDVCDGILPGLVNKWSTFEFVPTAILSRQIGGTRGKSLIFNSWSSKGDKRTRRNLEGSAILC